MYFVNQSDCLGGILGGILKDKMFGYLKSYSIKTNSIFTSFHHLALSFANSLPLPITFHQLLLTVAT